jgi:hypothetical protein
MMVNQPARPSTNLSSQILGEAALELLGAPLFARLLGTSNSHDNLSAYLPHAQMISLSMADMAVFTQLLEGIYGPAGGRGLALRIGRAAFKYARRCFGEETGLHSLEFRLLPPQRRLETGLVILSQVIADDTGDRITIENEPDCWVWRQASSTPDQPFQAKDHGCYLLIGLLQDFLSWAGGGHFYKVVETGCRAGVTGECVFRIDKKALD